MALRRAATMVKMQPYVKNWYEYFDQGKVMGLKCKRCGAVEFPPVPVCNACSGTDLEWAEISGEGELLAYHLEYYPDPPFVEFAPYFYGTVQIKEGPCFSSILSGIKVDEDQSLFEQLPLPVQAEVIQLNGYKFVGFRVKK
jgi:acetyl-CoA C-acetyltransferase